MIRKILFRNGRYLSWEKGDIHTAAGVLKESDLELAQGVVKTHAGKEFIAFDADFIDQLKNIHHGPQTLLLKDFAYLLLSSGIGKDSFVVDAGTGTGLLAIVFSRYGKKVVSYDISPSNLALARKNCALLHVENVELKLGDVCEKIEERNVDILTLDLPEPWRADFSCMKHGGKVLVCLPTIVQVMEFCNSAKMFVEKVVEILEREWYVEGRRVRPKSEMQGHTAFLVIARKQ